MSIHEFWHEDKRLYDAYRKAYYNRMSEQSWLNGLYVNIAINNLAGNIFKKKGEKAFEYPEEPANIFGNNTKKITPTNVEEEFRKLMFENSNWLKRRKSKK